MESSSSQANNGRGHYSTRRDKRGTKGGRGGSRGGHGPQTNLDNITVMTGDFKSFLDKSNAKTFKVYSDECTHSKLASLANSSHLNWEGCTPGTGYIVLPTSGKLKRIYHRNAKSLSSQSEIDDNQLERERQLRNILFTPSLKPFNFKLSCANCILESQPNGFVCIISSSSSVVDRARDLARTQAQIVREEGKELHSDHTDHVCTLPEQLLRLALPKGKKKATTVTPEQSTASEGILQCMVEQGLPVDKSDNAPTLEIKFGHHLKSILKLLDRNKEDRDVSNKYIFTMIRKKTKNDTNITVLDIDLPGGKRHLGETSFECAVRETEEETSLKINKSWLLADEEKDHNYGIGSEMKTDAWNTFFFCRPPLDENWSGDLVDITSGLEALNTR